MSSSMAERAMYFSGKIDHRAVGIFQLPNGEFQGQENINHTLRFITSNCSGLNGFLERYIGNPITGRPQTYPVFELTKKTHEADRRKANGDLYIKHLFYTAYLTDEMTAGKKYTPGERNLLTAVSLLHDVIEMKRKNLDTPDYDTSNFHRLLLNAHNVDGAFYMNGWRPRDIRKIVTMVSLLTPPDKPPEMEVEVWRKIKWEDFHRIMNLTQEGVREREAAIGIVDGLPPYSDREAGRIAEMVKDIKVAEIFANLRETADDIIWSRDGIREIPEMKDFTDRFDVFAERVDYLRTFPLPTFYKMRMANDLQTLRQLIRGQGLEVVSQ